MGRAGIDRLLEQAEANVQVGEQYIAWQLELIAHLKSHGCPVADAKRRLTALAEQYEALLRDRERLLKYRRAEDCH